MKRESTLCEQIACRHVIPNEMVSEPRYNKPSCFVPSSTRAESPAPLYLLQHHPDPCIQVRPSIPSPLALSCRTSARHPRSGRFPGRFSRSGGFRRLSTRTRWVDSSGGVAWWAEVCLAFEVTEGGTVVWVCRWAGWFRMAGLKFGGVGVCLAS